MTTSTDTLPGGTATLGGRPISRFGFGAMQLAGPWVMGPPADRDGAITVLRTAVELGITHIDTSDAYGPRITNQLIREALAPYPADLVIATKVGAQRDDEGGWPVARQPDQLRQQVEGNLESLGLDRLDLVNLRMGDAEGPREESLAQPMEALAGMQQEGLVGHLGLSNVTPAQVAQARTIATVACVQNAYNLAHRHDDQLIDTLAADGIAYVPFFPLGGFSPLQSATLDTVAARRGTTRIGAALAWLLQRSPNVLLIPGTSSAAHLRENVTAAHITLTEADLTDLDTIGVST